MARNGRVIQRHLCYAAIGVGVYMTPGALVGDCLPQAGDIFGLGKPPRQHGPRSLPDLHPRAAPFFYRQIMCSTAMSCPELAMHSPRSIPQPGRSADRTATWVGCGMMPECHLRAITRIPRQRRYGRRRSRICSVGFARSAATWRTRGLRADDRAGGPAPLEPGHLAHALLACLATVRWRRARMSCVAT